MVGEFGKVFETNDSLSAFRLNCKAVTWGTGSYLSGLDDTTGLVARFAFANNLNDSLGAFNATGFGTPTYVYDICDGQAVNLNGTSQYFTIPGTGAMNFTTAMTVCGWFVFDQIRAQVVLRANSKYVIDMTSGGQITVSVYTNSGATVYTAQSTAVLTAGKKYFLALTYNKVNVTVYLGEPDAGMVQIASVGGTNNIDSNSATVYVGASSTPALYNDCKIDNLQFFNVAKTIGQLEAIKSNLRSNMVAVCTQTSGNFHAGSTYVRNVENTDWTETISELSMVHATGDIPKSNGASWTRLARGTTGQVLKVNAAGTDIEWGQVSGLGLGTNLRTPNTTVGFDATANAVASSTSVGSAAGATVHTVLDTGNKVIVTVMGSVSLSNTAGTSLGGSVGLYIDGVLVKSFSATSSSSITVPFCIIYVATNLTAGSRTFDFRANNNSSSSNIQTTATANIQVIEFGGSD